MKLLKVILLGALGIQAALATIGAGVVYEVRTTGSDSNGGGFVCSNQTLPCVGGTGTDWSQQAAPQYALTGLTTSGASATVLTSLASADMVNNIIQITGGTNFIQAGPSSTTSFYQIISQVTGVSITLDRAATTGAGAAGTGNIGGALLSPAIAAAQTAFYTGSNAGNAGGNTTTFSSPVVFIQYSASVVYPITTATPNVAGGVISPGNSVYFVGYDTSGNRFVNNTGLRPTIQAQANNISVFNQVVANVEATYILNLIVDGNTAGGFTGVCGINSGNFTQYGWIIAHVLVENATNYAINFGNLLFQSEVTNSTCAGTGLPISCLGTHAAVHEVYGAQLVGNKIHNNLGIGVMTAGPTMGNYIYANGAQGIYVNAFGQVYFNNSIYGNVGDGVYTQQNAGNVFWGNIIESNGGYAINDQGNMLSWVSYGSTYGNTSGAFNHVTSPQNTGNLTPAASVFVNPSGGNFTINATAGGLALRATLAAFNGFDGVNVGFGDIGPMQHKDSAGPGPITVH